MTNDEGGRRREEWGTGNGEGGRRDGGFLVHAKLGFGGSERGAELGLGVPGGRSRLFPLTTIRHGSNHQGSEK